MGISRGAADRGQLAFGTLALFYRGGEGIWHAWKALGWLLAVPVLFFLASHPMVNQFDPDSPAAAIAAGYAFLPFRHVRRPQRLPHHGD